MKAPRNITRTLLGLGGWMLVATLLACTVTLDSEGETQNRALIDRLPAGSTAILWLDFEALSAAVPPEQWEEYEDMFQDDEDMAELEQFIEATGVDPREDINQVALAIMPGTTGANDDAPIVLASVDFDEDRLLEFLADAETTEYEGTTIYAFTELVRQFEPEVEEFTVPEGADGIQVEADDDGFLAILDASTIAVGSVETVRVAIDVDSGRRDSLKMDPHMNDLISDVAGQGQVWAVATRDTWDENLDSLGPDGGGMVPTNAIQSIETVTMSMRMGDGMSMRLAGIAAEPADAELLAQTLNGWAAMGKIALQQEQPELFDILDRGVRIGNDDRTVMIEANLTEADIEVLQRLAEENMGSAVVGEDAR